jgi:hypothetical protein
MKKTIIVGIIASVSGLMSPRVIHAQGTLTYLSNLGQPSAGSLSVGSDSWVAGGVQTGTNADGYLLDSVQLAMTDASGNPSGFTAMLYSATDTTGVFPASSLGTLTGSPNPTAVGMYTYTPTSSVTLLPSTVYFIVLTAGTTVGNGAYEWTYADTSSYNPSDNWAGGFALGSNNGLSWYAPGPPFSYPKYAITATAVPEPGVLSLFVLSGLGFLWHRREWVSPEY